MATQAQILANRSNARKSTGPRTAEGKAVVAQNAVKHGLCGRDTIIVGEDPGEFESYRARMLAELDPVGEVESNLAERIVGLSWRLKRADRLQATAFDSLYARQKHSPMEQYDRVQDADGGSILGRALVRDFGDARVIDRLSMYERRIEHSLYRTMAELKRHRILQEVGPGKMWELRQALAGDDGARMENHGRDARATGLTAGGPADPPEGGPSGDDAGMGHVAGGRTEADCREPACCVPVRAYVSRASCPRFEGDPGPKGHCVSGSTQITPHGVTTNEDGRAIQPAAERGNYGRDARATTTLHDVFDETKPILPPAHDGQVLRAEALRATGKNFQ
jgi:hypothetical protein